MKPIDNIEPPAPERREAPLKKSKSAILIIDMQNMECGNHLRQNAEVIGSPESKKKHYFTTLNRTVIPNIRWLIDTARHNHVEVIYTVIESLTIDGRDRSLDYKISGLHAPKGSWEAQVIDELTPQANEIVIPKTSCSVFNSTNIHYVLRNLDIEQLVVAGVVSEQCVESAIRDAADLGYLVTMVTDACATYSEEQQQSTIDRMVGHYARGMTTVALIDEIKDLS